METSWLPKLMVSAFLGAVWLAGRRGFGSAPAGTGAPAPPLDLPPVPTDPDPIAVAFLAGGVNQVIRVVLFRLARRGVVAFEGPFVNAAAAPDDLPALDRMILDAIGNQRLIANVLRDKGLAARVEEALADCIGWMKANDLVVARAFVKPVLAANWRGAAWLERLRLAFHDAAPREAARYHEAEAVPPFSGGSLFLLSLFGFGLLAETPDKAFADSFRASLDSQAAMKGSSGSCGGGCSGCGGDGGGGCGGGDGGGCGGCGGCGGE